MIERCAGGVTTSAPLKNLHPKHSELSAAAPFPWPAAFRVPVSGRETAHKTGMANPKLKPDAGTLAALRELGRLQCTRDEAAASLQVGRTTLWRFLDKHTKARAAFEQGLEEGRIELRRTQFHLAKTNATMAIFLGQNLLGQNAGRTTPKPKQANVSTSAVRAGIHSKLARLADAGKAKRIPGNPKRGRTGDT